MTIFFQKRSKLYYIKDPKRLENSKIQKKADLIVMEKLVKFLEKEMDQ